MMRRQVSRIAFGTRSAANNTGKAPRPAAGGATHYGFAGKGANPVPVGQTQKQPAPASRDDPRAFALHKPMFDSANPAKEGFERTRMENLKNQADRTFNDMAKRDPWMYYLRDNLNGLCLLQLFVEQGLTLVFMLMLWFGVITAEGVDAACKNMLFGYDIGISTHSVWPEHVYLLGSGEAKDEGLTLYIPKQFLTLYSQAHQISYHLLPLQLPIVYNVYPAVLAKVRKLPLAQWMSQAEKSKIIYNAKQKAMKPKGNFDVI
jgi:hypothetical protein